MRSRNVTLSSLGAGFAQAQVCDQDALVLPASVAYRGDTLYATNFAFHDASAGLPAHPGLVRVAP